MFRPKSHLDGSWEMSRATLDRCQWVCLDACEVESGMRDILAHARPKDSFETFMPTERSLSSA